MVGGGDFAVQRGRKVRGWRAETYHVEGIGGLAAQLQRKSFTKVDVAQYSDIDIPISRTNKIIARRVAVRTIGSNAKARAVVGKRRSVEPRVSGNSCGFYVD